MMYIKWIILKLGQIFSRFMPNTSRLHATLIYVQTIITEIETTNLSHHCEYCSQETVIHYEGANQHAYNLILSCVTYQMHGTGEIADQEQMTSGNEEHT